MSLFIFCTSSWTPSTQSFFGIEVFSTLGYWGNSFCCEDNKRYFGLENSRFNFTVSLVLHFHLDSSDDSDNYLENLTACELQNKSNCQSKKWNLITPKPTRTIAWRVTQSVFCPHFMCNLTLKHLDLLCTNVSCSQKFFQLKEMFVCNFMFSCCKQRNIICKATLLHELP